MKQKDLILPIYAPSFLLAIAQGLLIPVLPLYVQSLGASFGLISLAIAATAFGTLLADVPAGVVLQRFGRKSVMLTGALALAVSSAATGLAAGYPELVVYQLIGGVATALWNISRMAYIAEVISVEERGRVISTFGGVMRIGTFIGPALGGFVASRYGLATPLFLTAALAVAAAVVSAVAVEEMKGKVSHRRPMRWRLVGQLLVNQRRDLVTAGGAQVIMQMLRQARQIMIPLYGASVLGLDVVALGTISSVSAAIDMSLFIPAGIIMDRVGRKFAVVPSLLLLALGMALIPLSASFVGLLLAAAVIGVGNGIGSGTMMTVGSDLAPKGAAGEFLGLWRLVGDGGSFGGPVILGSLADAVGLSLASLGLAGIGVLGAVGVVLLVEETLHTRRASAPG